MLCGDLIEPGVEMEDHTVGGWKNFACAFN